MWVNTSERSDAPEMMDDFAMEGAILKDALDKIASINKLLGGNAVTINGVASLLKNHSKDKIINIVDLGCGNGDMLRALAKYAIKNNLNLKLTGIDANQFTVNHAKSLSSAFKNIHFECKDIFESEITACDIMLCTLTLHHFTNPAILKLITNCQKHTTLGIVINDLHRSKLAYYLFKAICFIFRLNNMSKQDGLVSILRGFKKADLQLYTKQLGLKNCSINWKWAFRYQWIIKLS